MLNNDRNCESVSLRQQLRDSVVNVNQWPASDHDCSTGARQMFSLWVQVQDLCISDAIRSLLALAALLYVIVIFCTFFHFSLCTSCTIFIIHYMY